MNSLPPHLVKWREQLSLFSDDIALVIGEMAMKLAGSFGSFGSDSDAGEPNGFDGVATTGPLGRLLMSEWALLDAYPDEFLRRLMSKEQSYYKLARKPKDAAKETIVLFDGGPSQLGGPRIAQLALLVILAERAERTKSTLRWGALQSSSGDLHENLNTVSVNALLSSTSLSPTSTDSLKERLSKPDVKAASETWLVGDEELCNEALQVNASCVSIEELVVPGPLSLLLRARASAKARPKEVELELPSGRICVRILRDPFSTVMAQRSTNKHRLRTDLPLVFSTGGQKLHLHTEEGLMTMTVPNSPRSVIGKPSVYVPPEGHQVVAVGRCSQRKRNVVVTQSPVRDEQGSISHMRVLSKRGTTCNRYFAFHGAKRDKEVAALSPFAFLDGAHEECVYISGGKAIYLAEGRVKEVDDNLLTECTPQFQHIVCGKMGEDGVIKRVSHPPIATSRLPMLDARSEMTAAKIFFGSNINYFAYELTANTWVSMAPSASDTLRGSQAPKLLSIEEGEYAFGLRHHRDLLVLSKHKTQVFAVGDSGYRLIFTESAPIATLAYSEERNVIAYVTQSGRLGVYSLTYKCIVHRMDRELA